MSRRMVKLFSTAVICQVLLSLTNFIVGLLLIRYTHDADYGLFVLAQATIALATTAQGAWVSGPLSVLAAKRDPLPRRDMIGAVSESLKRVTRLLAVPLLLAAPAGAAVGAWSWPMALVAMLTVVAGWFTLRREFYRGLLQLYARPGTMLRADLLAMASLIAIAALAAFGPLDAAMVAVGGLIVSSWLGSTASHVALGRDPGWTDDGEAARYWQQMRPLALWSTAGALIYWTFSQSYNYVLAARVDLAAVADVNAARLLLMPAIVITVGIRGVLFPMAARWLVEIGMERLLKRLLVIFVAVAILQGIYFLMLWLGRDFVTGTILNKVIRDREQLLLLWGGIALIGLVREIAQMAIMAMEQFKALAAFTAASAALSLAVMWFGLDVYGPPAALIGQIAGELVGLAGIFWLIRRARRLPPPSMPAAG